MNLNIFDNSILIPAIFAINLISLILIIGLWYTIYRWILKKNSDNNKGNNDDNKANVVVKNPTPNGPSGVLIYSEGMVYEDKENKNDVFENWGVELTEKRDKLISTLTNEGI